MHSSLKVQRRTAGKYSDFPATGFQRSHGSARNEIAAGCVLAASRSADRKCEQAPGPIASECYVTTEEQEQKRTKRQSSHRQHRQRRSGDCFLSMAFRANETNYCRDCPDIATSDAEWRKRTSSAKGCYRSSLSSSDLEITENGSAT